MYFFIYMNTQRHAYDICICLYIHVDILFDKLPCIRKISFKAHTECSTYILSGAYLKIYVRVSENCYNNFLLSSNHQGFRIKKDDRFSLFSHLIIA